MVLTTWKLMITFEVAAMEADELEEEVHQNILAFNFTASRLEAEECLLSTLGPSLCKIQKASFLQIIMDINHEEEVRSY